MKHALTVSERIMMIADPESDWERCVESCRSNAQQPKAPPSPTSTQTGAQLASARERGAKRKAWLPKGWTDAKQIAEGGQGWTYKVRRSSEENGEWFVFKRLKNADRADRFRSEIKALRALHHRGILQITEDGDHEGKPYYIAEYCGSGDLSKRNLNGATALEKLQIFRQICSAVAAAHTAKIIHRDIKPSNILVRTDGSMAVGDFGLCLHLDAEERLTLTQEAVGARNYMAPELEDGRRDDVTPAADVYSLGKILYFLFAGRCFSREKHHDSGYDLTRPAEDQPENGIQFVYEILDKSVVEHPHSRFQDASALNAAIDGAIRRIALNAHILNLSVKQPCLYCVDGEYQQLQGSETNEHSMILVCRSCGNTQHFGPPLNGWSAWWMRR